MARCHCPFTITHTIFYTHNTTVAMSLSLPVVGHSLVSQLRSDLLALKHRLLQPASDFRDDDREHTKEEEDTQKENEVEHKENESPSATTSSSDSSASSRHVELSLEYFRGQYKTLRREVEAHVAEKNKIISDMEEFKSKAMESNNAQQSELASLRASLDQHSISSMSLADELSATRKQCNELQQENEKIATSLQDAQQENEDLRQKNEAIPDLESALSSLRSEFDSLLALTAEKDNELDMLNEKYQEVRQAFDKKEEELRMEKENSIAIETKIAEQIVVKEEEIMSLNQQLKEKEVEKNKLIDMKEKEMEEIMGSRIEELKSQTVELNEYTSLQSELEKNLTQMSEITQKHMELEEKEKRMEREIEHLTTEKKAGEEDRASMNKEIAELKQSLNDKEELQNKLEYELNIKMENENRLKLELLNMKMQLKLTAATNLGDAKAKDSDSSAATHRDEIERLENAHKKAIEAMSTEKEVNEKENMKKLQQVYTTKIEEMKKQFQTQLQTLQSEKRTLEESLTTQSSVQAQQNAIAQQQVIERERERREAMERKWHEESERLRGEMRVKNGEIDELNERLNQMENENMKLIGQIPTEKTIMKLISTMRSEQQKLIERIAKIACELITTESGSMASENGDRFIMKVIATTREKLKESKSEMHIEVLKPLMNQNQSSSVKPPIATAAPAPSLSVTASSSHGSLRSRSSLTGNTLPSSTTSSSLQQPTPSSSTSAIASKAVRVAPPTAATINPIIKQQQQTMQLKSVSTTTTTTTTAAVKSVPMLAGSLKSAPSVDNKENMRNASVY